VSTITIAILLTCYNRQEVTIKCLRNLYQQDIPQNAILKTYLVDDGCTDGTGKAVAKQFPQVKVLQGDGNLYWCGGMRFAWSEAIKEDFDYYIWLNDDTILLPKAITTLLKTHTAVTKKKKLPAIIIGSCRDPLTKQHTYGGITKRNSNTRLADQPIPPRNHIQHCETMNGNLVLISRNVLKLLGNLNSAYTHAFGDVDYGMRARKKNVDLWIAPGHLAECPRNSGIPPWTNPSIPFGQRWQNMSSPHGVPLRQWYQYVKYHTGWQWPIYFAKPLLRVLFPFMWTMKSTPKDDT